MSKKLKINPLAAAVSTALATSLASAPVANADTSPFTVTALSSGYMVADIGEGQCGEGKCGGDKAKSEGACGEGKCGGDKAAEGSCGGDKAAEGSCGGDKAGEGSCGGDKAGEGSCGGDKAAEKAADAPKAGSGSTGPLSLLGLLTLAGLRRRNKRS